MSDAPQKPIHLVEDEGTGDRFLVYGTENGARLNIQFEGETLWMSQAQIGQLFGRDRSSIAKHIINIFEDAELEESTSVQKVHRSQGRPVAVYNLDMIISVGYRVSSVQATLFRRWATGILVQFALRGFVVDSPRLKQTGNIDRIRELREIIRDLRSDEANIYAELGNICAMCQDYDGSEPAARQFFQRTQAKLVYAVTSHTPAEIISDRSDYTQDHMGLTSWPNQNIRKADVVVAKNYLAASEIKELNRLTTILLDIFEDQAEIGRLVAMQDVTQLLDNQLKGLNRVVLNSGGSVQAGKARLRAEKEYLQFSRLRKAKEQLEAKRNIAAIAKESKDLK